MPRSIYHQCPGNPIQFQLLPEEPLQIEFAHRRGVDNDDMQFTLRVIKELVIASLVALIACWSLTLSAGVTLSFLLLAAAIALVGWRVLRSQIAVLRNISILLTALALGYHLFRIPFEYEIYFALTATALLAREIVRHFTFVATVTPVPLREAWRIRTAVNWHTLGSSLLLLPIGLSVALPDKSPLCWAAAIGGALTVAGFCSHSPQQYIHGLRDAILSWCSYNRTDDPIPGILISPSGRCTWRHTMLLAVVMVNSLLAVRLIAPFAPVDLHGNPQAWNSAGLLDPVLNLFVMALPSVFASFLPVGFVLLAIAIVGAPVLGKLAIPQPGRVPASEWNEITRRIRQSTNEKERNSLYMGRVSYDQSPLVVPEEVFREHAHFLGDSGSGKTARGLAPLVEQIVSRGNSSVMVIDLKGDSPELLQTLYHGAKSARELSDDKQFHLPVRYFNLRDDKATYAFNPFRLKCWHQLNDLLRADILCGAMGLIYGSDYGEGYFSSANASVLYTTISNFPTIGNFEELRDRIHHVVSSSKRYGLDDKARDAGNHVKMTVTKLASIAALNVTEDYAPNASTFEHRIDPSQLFRRPEALYFSLSATLGPGSSPEIARFATFMLLTTATLSSNRTPVYIVIDEFQRMASRNLDYLLQLARSMDVAVILANQSMEDLRPSGLVPTLETNCRYRQWFSVSGWDDQERLSRASGDTVDSLKSESVSQSRGERGATVTTSRSRQEFIGPRLTKNDIKLVSDEDRKSIVLLNRGAGYAQFGGLPVVVENDFHITREEYKARRDAPWPSGDEGTFVPSDWDRPQPVAPHRGRTRTTTPHVSQETIVLQGSQHEPPHTQRPGKKGKRARKGRTSKSQTPKQNRSNVNLFEQYLKDHPLESPADPQTEEGSC